MQLLFWVVLVGHTAASLASQLGPYTSRCQTRWFNQKKDHFSFKPHAQALTFKQRILYDTESFSPGGPIFFYFGKLAARECTCPATHLRQKETRQTWSSMSSTRG